MFSLRDFIPSIRDDGIMTCILFWAVIALAIASRPLTWMIHKLSRGKYFY